MNDDVEDYDFTPASNSSLLTLFNNSSDFSDNSSLIYTAPKQPKPVNTTGTQNDVAKVESSVICAKIVQVWKLVDAKYEATGKLGFAVIGSSERSYEIIIYKDKKNVLMRTKIYPGFEVSMKKDDFISFFDNTGDNWLVKFNNHDEATSTADTVEQCGGKIIKLENVTTRLSKPTHKPKDIKEDKPTSEAKSVSADNTSDNKAKADILTRIAKMGQSILPNKTLDTEEEIETVDACVESHTTETLPKSQYLPLSTLTSTTVRTPPSNTFMGQSMTYDPLNLYIAENRANNTEVRLNLSDISEKLNHIMKLVDTGKSKNELEPDILKRKIKVLQLRSENLFKELNLVQEENGKLKQQMQQQDDLLEYGKQIEELRLQKEQAMRKIEEMELERNAYKSSVAELSAVVEAQRIANEELKNTIASHSTDEIELKNKIMELESTVSNLEIKLKQEQSPTSLPKEIKEKNTNITTMLKEEMNKMYANITGCFTENEHDISQNDRIIIAQNIKSTTLKIIQNFQQIFGQPELN